MRWATDATVGLDFNGYLAAETNNYYQENEAIEQTISAHE
jgi:hypothetical protein